MAPSTPLLLYDGECGFCDGTVQFVLRRDPGGALAFATLQGAQGRRLLAEHPALAGVDSVIWVDADGPRVRTDAVLRLGRYLGGPWALLAALGRLVPRALRDAAYDAFARRRYRWFGRVDACALPAPEERRRFLDG